MFKDVLRTFEAEILKIFEDIQPKNRKKECALPGLTAEYPAISKQHPWKGWIQCLGAILLSGYADTPIPEQ